MERSSGLQRTQRGGQPSGRWVEEDEGPGRSRGRQSDEWREYDREEGNSREENLAFDWDESELSRGNQRGPLFRWDLEEDDEEDGIIISDEQESYYYPGDERAERNLYNVRRNRDFR
jgi:hypothetical protein